MKDIPIKKLGEFGLVERIRRRIAPAVRSPIVVGLGDDAFVARLPAGCLMVVTKDLLVEDVHFRRSWMSAGDLGHKSMAVNLSDLAAMGACRPLYGFVGLAVPADTPVDFVDKLYAGMDKMASKNGLQIVGGDTVSSNKGIVISITLVGGVEKGYLLTRSGAAEGDIICVTGTFGDSGAGLYILEKGLRKSTPYARFLVRRHLLPEPRLDVSAKLARTGKITAMIDSSDGLAASVAFIAGSSGRGARVDLEKIPISDALWELFAREGKVNPVKLALTGGEDYELVFTASPDDIPALVRLVPGITPVGVMTREKRVRYYSNGVFQKIDTRGFQHFHA